MQIKKDIKRIFIRFPEGKAKAFTFSYDDGVEQDVQLISLLEKYHLKCTFNINSGLYASEDTVFEPGTIHRRMTRKACLQAYQNEYCEVATHGLKHTYFDQLSPANMLMEVLADRTNLEEDYQKLIRGLAYPFGSYNDQVMELLKSSGIAYARTTNVTHGFKLPQNWFEWEGTCHHKDANLMSLVEDFLNRIPEKEPMLFYVWGHTYEFERDDNWDIMTQLCERIHGKTDVWYATNIEIVDYVSAYHALQWAVGMEMVHNPTAIDIYCCLDGKIICIPAATTIRL